MANYLAAIDCGTSSVKAGIFRMNGRVFRVVEEPCSCLYLSGNRIEQDPALIVQKSFLALKKAVRASRVAPKDIAAISVSTQRATVICVDENGRAIGNAISWQDMRGAAEIEKLRRGITDRVYQRITGLPNNPVFSLGKILWIKKNAPSLFRKTDKFVLVHDYLLHKLGVSGFVSDWSNASLTGLLDIQKFKWSKLLLALTGLRPEKLSSLVPSGEQVGKVSREASRLCDLVEGTPVVSGGGDQQCAAIGAGAVTSGVVAVNLGTAAVVAAYADKKVIDPKRQVMSCAHAVPGKWNVEGLQNSAGGSFTWIKGIVDHRRYFNPAVSKRISKIQPGSQGLFYYPYLAGASAPHWNPAMRGMFLGLTYAHGKDHFVRAVLEGISVETRQILDVFTFLKIPVREIRLTGGGSQLEMWSRIQADIYGRNVTVLENSQVSLLGAAILAAWGVGLFRTIPEAARHMVRVKTILKPIPKNISLYQEIYRKYCKAYPVLERLNL